jgi:hypothetical protein
MGPLILRSRIGRRAACAGVIAAALLGSPAGAAATPAAATHEVVSAALPPISAPGQGPFVPRVGDWEGTVGGYPASFELVYEPTYVAFGGPPYGYEDLTTVDPDSCPLAANRYSVGVVGEDDVTPMGVGGSFPLAGEGITGGIVGSSSATLSSSFDTGTGTGGAACRGTLMRAMHPATRRTVDDGAWTLRFADGESQTFTVSAGGRLAIGIDFPAALGRCGGPRGNVNLFIAAGGAASVRGPRGAYALRLSFTGVNRASGRITAAGRCRAFELAMKATLSSGPTAAPRS